MGIFSFFKKRSEQTSNTSVQFTAATTPVGEITHLLDMTVPLNLFKNHDVPCTLIDNELRFEAQHITAHARLFRRAEGPVLILQLDFCLEVGFGKTIMESCTGIGDDATTAIADAWKNFAMNSLHVMLAAFFHKDQGKQVDMEIWTIEGHQYTAFLSPIITKGTMPASFSTQWLTDLDAIIKQQPLPPGIHWIRFYRGADATQVYGSEILLDNANWSAIESQVQKMDYPVADSFFSFRIFIILKPAFDVARAATIIACNASREILDIHKILQEDGFTEVDAAKAYAFIPLAFGRAFLEQNSKAKFSPIAILITEKETDIILMDEPIFAAAYTMAYDALTNSMPNREHFINLLSHSAEFNAYNNALNDGATKESLDTASFGAPLITL
ncbi:MAG: hypothetical protein J0I41_01810 [Filimonas sp.]|nr:hypothetical protein [Filimonas sp.]